MDDGCESPRGTCERLVEVSVYDKQSNEMRVFRCDLHLLESSMTYFTPIIKCYLDEEERQKSREEKSLDRASSTGARSVKNSKTKAHEATKPLKRKGKEEKPPIPLHVNCDMSTFSWLMAYVEGKQRSFTPKNAVSLALSSNFLHMTQLVEMTLLYIKDHLVEVILSGVNMDCFTGELLARLASMMSEGDVARAFLKLFDWHAEDSPNRRFLTALIRHMLCDRFGEGRPSSLRWCGLCGALFDQQELQHIERRYKNVRLPVCPRVTKNSVGHRGELLKTHVASKQEANIKFPPLSWHEKEVEAWAWRVVGSLYLFVCRRCNCCVSLTNTTCHSCPGGTANFSRAEGVSSEDADALLAWFDLAKNLYPGGLRPMYCPKEEAVREPFLLLTPKGGWLYDDEGDSSVPGVWSTHPAAVEESVDAKGYVNIGVMNGFERWLMEELQQMMEDFDQSGLHAKPSANQHGSSPAQAGPYSPNTTMSSLSPGPRNIVGGIHGEGAPGRPGLRGAKGVGDTRMRPLSNGTDLSRKVKEGAPPSGRLQKRDKLDSGARLLS